MKTGILIVLLMMLSPPGFAQSLDSARDLYLHGRYKAAGEALSALIGKSPQDAELHFWYGKTCLKLRRWDEAVREFEKAVKLDPGSSRDHLWLARAYGHKAEHTWALLAFGPARTTRNAYEDAARMFPEDLDIRFDLLEFYIQAPGIVGGGMDKAEAQAGEIAKLSPRAGYSAWAEIYEDKKDWARAREELVEATQKFPKDADTFADLAEFELRRGQREAAAADAEKALALNPGSARARLALAAAWIGLKKNLPEALKSLRELAAGPLSDDDPGFEEVYYWIGRALLAQDRKTEARQAFETSLGFDPDYSRSKQALAQIK